MANTYCEPANKESNTKIRRAAGMVSRNDNLGGIWGDLGAAIIGAFIGGFLFNITDIFVYGTIESILSSTMGAIILLWAIRMFR